MPFLQEFRRLHRAWQPAPFWFLNDELEPDEMQRQVRLMAEQHIGGFFLHARMGRVTPYLSERWFECIGAALEEAARHGLHAWIYDEDNWPSGYAGGAVLAQGDWTRQAYLRLDPLGAAPRDTDLHDGVVAVLEEAGGHQWRVIPANDPAAIADHRTGDGRRFVVTRELHRARREFCPEEIVHGYTDVFNPAVTDLFIETTYEEYRRRFDGYFGSTVRGFFFDEPQYHELGLWGDDVVRFPWSELVAERYRNHCGRDLITDLPALAFETPDSASVRYWYYRSLAEQFREAFTARLAAWCTGAGVELTGHVILEEHPRMAVRSIGDPMLHYRDPHVPGIDHLGKDLDLAMFWSSSHVLCKQVQSAREQLGRDRAMCETYAGGTNWFGPTEQKWMGDWMQALGVNWLCYHAFHYSLRGYRKRDYPPTFNYQQPWFEFSGALGKHFGRLGWALAQGNRVVDLLLIHPMESFFATQRDDEFTGNDELSDSFKTTVERLVHSGFDYDLGNEFLLAESGEVSRGELSVGAASYRLVVVPPVVRLREETRSLLERFGETGGTIAWFEPFSEGARLRVPGSIPLGGWRDERAWATLATLLERNCSRIIESDPADLEHIVFQRRVVSVRGGRAELTALASSRTRPARAALTVRGESEAIVALDTVTGSPFPIEARRVSGGFELALELGGPRSWLLMGSDVRVIEDAVHGPLSGSGAAEGHEFAPGAQPRGNANQDLSERRITLLSASCPARAEPSTLNALPLETVEFELEGQGAEEMSVLAASARITELRASVDSRTFRCRYPFSVSGDAVEVEIAIEAPDAVDRALLDGRPLSLVPGNRFFIDGGIAILEGVQHLEPGDHELLLEGRIGPRTEIEPAYVLGAFGVTIPPEGRPCIDEVPGELYAGSWTEQGYPFYAGIMRYSMDLVLEEQARVRLEFSEAEGRFPEKDPRRVLVDGQPIATRAWYPWTVEVPWPLAAGTHRVEIDVATHLRNALGPFHAAAEDEVDCFSPADHFAFDSYDPGYRLRPAGILGELTAIIRPERGA